MALDGRLKWVKFLLLSFNFVFFTFGLTIMTAGVWRLLTMNNFPKLVQAGGVAIFLIVVGFIFLFIALIGCYGVWKRNFCMVTTFAILLFCCVIMDVVIVIGVYTFTNKVLDILDNEMQSDINSYNTSKLARERIDVFQEMVGCCGQVNASDWVNFQPDGISVPDTCCRIVTVDCGAGAMNNESIIYTEGCVPFVEYMYKMMKLWSGVIGLVFAFIKIFVIVLACTLMYGIHKGYKIQEPLLISDLACFRCFQRRAQPVSVSVSEEGSPHHRVK
ncbi:CD63 antigen-like [Ictalurus furcatus]|uniref:CD63 antigen-like n=1 Tax=Ictalurus furcatus TaxID=66913 RepID=UPI00234FE5A1|nr:CD63 antigen-like [Ictalurus furcatus]XP_053499854.1 CD63 antigen-like [Ictalurus furcatus]